MPRAQPLRGQAGAVCETDRRPGFPIISEQPVSALLNDLTMLHGAWGLNQPFDSEVAAGWTESVAERRVSAAGAAHGVESAERNRLMQPPRSSAEFWPHYVLAHRHPATRAFQFQN